MGARGIRSKLERLGQFNRPRGAAIDPLRVIRELGIKKLNEAVASTRCGDGCGVRFQRLFLFVELAGNEGSLFLARWGGQSQKRRSVSGILTDNLLKSSVGEDQLIEAHNRYMEWREIASQAGVDPIASVRVPLDDAAAEH